MQKFEKRIATFSFLMLQTILYGSFLIIDFTNTNINLSNRIKFTMIVLCFCYVLFYKKSTDKSILFCLRVALFFTVISDLFILLLDFYFYGVLTFIIVQQIYGIKLDITIKQKGPGFWKDYFHMLLPRFVVQILLAGIYCLLLIGLGVNPEKLLVITVFYFISIVTNVIRSIRIAFHDPTECSNWLFAIGMISFLLCDISVGLFNLSDFIPLSDGLYEFIYSTSAILMWAFYAPSQVLIALSVKNSKIDKKK